jgi:hypothetical protein
MSFNRLRYDDCATKLHNQRSVGVGEYRLSFDNFENNNQCYSLTGPIGSKSDISTAKNNCSLNWGEMTQIESDLQSRNIPTSECNENATNLNYSKNSSNQVEQENTQNKTYTELKQIQVNDNDLLKDEKSKFNDLLNNLSQSGLF